MTLDAIYLLVPIFILGAAIAATNACQSKQVKFGGVLVGNGMYVESLLVDEKMNEQREELVEVKHISKSQCVSEYYALNNMVRRVVFSCVIIGHSVSAFGVHLL